MLMSEAIGRPLTYCLETFGCQMNEKQSEVVAGIMDEETFLREMKVSFSHKFASKPEVIDGNMAALEMALKEVQ